MVSFDVENIFANIPLVERIDLADNYINKGNPGFKHIASDLKRLFSCATTKTHFCLRAHFTIRLMVQPWVPPQSPFLPIYSWNTMRSCVWNNTRILQNYSTVVMYTTDFTIFPRNRLLTLSLVSFTVNTQIFISLWRRKLTNEIKPQTSLSPPRIAKRPSRVCLSIFCVLTPLLQNRAGQNPHFTRRLRSITPGWVFTMIFRN